MFPSTPSQGSFTVPFHALIIGGKDVARVIEHPKIMAVTLTGSTPAGKSVASKAGEMLKKTVLELGGSDPYIIVTEDVSGPRGRYP